MSDPGICPHPRRVLLRIDCGAGGKQFRRYCLDCWKDLNGAIAHAKALAEIGDGPVIDGDLEVLHAARQQYLDRIWCLP